MTSQDDKPASGNSAPGTEAPAGAGGWSLRQKAPGAEAVPVSGEVLVGREGCDITLTSAKASRKHAKLSVAGDVLKIEDLGSTNGTFVNGERIEAMELKPGDELRFDTQVFVVFGPRPPAAQETVFAAAVGRQSEVASTQLSPPAGVWTLIPKGPGPDATGIVLQGEVTVGREGCDIGLAGEGASRRHATLSVTAGGLRVEDTGSANGTFVNDERVKAAELKPGDELRFATETFIVGGGEAPEARAGDDNQAAARPAQAEPESRPASEPEPAQPPAEPESKPSSAPEPAQPPAEPESKPSAAPEPVQPPAEPRSEPDVEEAPPDQQAGTDRPVWYERESANRTSLVGAEQMQGQFAEGGTQLVRGVKELEAPSLIGTSGEWAGRVIKLDADAMTLGRAGTDIILDEPSVSTKHARIVRDGKRWKVIDLMSANGVYVNGKKSQVAFLTPGDALRFGRLELRFVTDSTQVPSRASPGGEMLSSRKSGWPGLWLYFAIGTAVVLGIGAYLLFVR